MALVAWVRGCGPDLQYLAAHFWAVELPRGSATLAGSQRHWGARLLSSGDDACDARGDGGGQDPSGGDHEVGEPLLGAAEGRYPKPTVAASS